MIISGSDRRCSAGETKRVANCTQRGWAEQNIKVFDANTFLDRIDDFFTFFFWKMGFVIEAKRSENKISELKKTSNIKMIFLLNI